MKAFLQKNIYYFVTIIFFVIIGGIVLLTTTKDQITLWVNAHYNHFFDQFFKIINWGGEPIFSTVAAIGLWILKGWRVALKAVVCFLSVVAVTQFMKYIIFPGTLRPVLYFEEGILRFIEGVTQLETESFPSGHTSASFSLATFFALYLPKKDWHWIFAMIAGLVGYGRIYMSQHFITDVYTGMIVGVVVTTLAYYFYPKSWEKHEKKNQAIYRKA